MGAFCPDAHLMRNGLCSCSSFDTAGSNETLRQIAGGQPDRSAIASQNQADYHDQLYDHYRKEGYSEKDAESRAREESFFNQMNTQATSSSR